MLADLGADVIKVDPPGGRPDMPRRSTGPLAQNLGKRSIVLDLKHSDGIRVALDLAASADVIVQNYRPGSLAALGLGYDDIRRRNQKVIYATICGFGDNTSYAKRGAFGATAHAEAGWLWIQQQAQGGQVPFAPGVMIADIATGLTACTAILAAIYDRERTGLGQEINVALMDSQLALLSEAAGPALAKESGDDWKPFRHGLQQARDGYLAINLGSPKNWPRLASAMGHSDMPLPTDKADADALVAHWVSGCTTKEAAEALDAAGVPYGVMLTIHEVLAHPYFSERGLIVEVSDPLQGSVRTIASPLFFSNALTTPSGAAPLAGEHSREILEELGYDDQEMERLIGGSGVQAADSDVRNLATD
jgi:crotonobetainyl-CoA:carnitine CoA-transferase CaiB-like acyl-CoA transferase